MVQAVTDSRTDPVFGPPTSDAGTVMRSSLPTFAPVTVVPPR